MTETPLPVDQRPRRTRRRWLRALVAVAVVLVLLVGGAFVATAVMKLPPPQTLARLEFAPPSTWGDYFPYRTIEAGEPRPLESAPASMPETVPWKGEQIPFDEFLTSTSTNSFVVLQDGKLAYEWYADGYDDSTLQSSFSMAKSLVSLLVGQAIARGELSEDDRVVDLLPDYETGTAYDQVTVRELLDMTAGIDVSEVYNEYWPFTGTSRMFLTTDLPGFVKDNRSVDYEPGTKGVYRSVETETLGLILAEVTGQNLSDLLSEGIWKPVGAESPARWSLDQEDGTEKAFASVNATARDFARVGQMVLDDGRVGDQQVVPRSWITRIETPAPLEVDGWPYSAQWWHPPGGDGADLSMLGVYGQYTYVNPETGTVIVKLSDYGTDQDEQETYDVLRSVADHLAAQPAG
ncbi:serine hydrolase domain-containing protein [Nocardioides sp.]|uniref:serine hydrolase domain-containing protein n=1 Tax=Nocardioides sp. TaxID=35761 RepID=UPI0037849FDA